MATSPSAAGLTLGPVGLVGVLGTERAVVPAARMTEGGVVPLAGDPPSGDGHQPQRRRVTLGPVGMAGDLGTDPAEVPAARMNRGRHGTVGR